MSGKCEVEHPRYGRCIRSAGHDVDPARGESHWGEAPMRVPFWPQRWMVRDMVDDHGPEGRTTRQVIGIFLRPGALPVLVACGPPGAGERWRSRGGEQTLCLNQVGEGGDFEVPPRRPHLSRWSTVTLSGDLLALLHEAGEVEMRSADGREVVWRVRLLEEFDEREVK